jgi:hypothetical protein
LVGFYSILSLMMHGTMNVKIDCVLRIEFFSINLNNKRVGHFVNKEQLGKQYKDECEIHSVAGHRVLVGKPEGKMPLRRPRRRWEDNIKMDLQEVGVGGGDWMELAQNKDRWRALVGTVRNFRVP